MLEHMLCIILIIYIHILLKKAEIHNYSFKGPVFNYTKSLACFASYSAIFALT
jgi:phage-related holin